MSHNNLHKKKPRFAKNTLLMFGEGLHEEIFLKYLKSVYNYNSGVGVIIKNGKGGNPVEIVTNACRELGSFDRRVVVLDNDKCQSEIEQARIEAKQKGIELIENSPCLEAMFLSVLREGMSFSHKQTAWCKKEFESKYLAKQRRVEIREYKNVFPKDLLEKTRCQVDILNQLISLMENK